MWGFLDYLPGILLPSAMLYFFFWIPLKKVRRAKFWRATPCVVVYSSVKEDETDSGLYTFVVRYEYEVAGYAYSSSRYSFSSSATAGRRGKKQLATRFAPGTKALCYVDPENPADAVIERGVTWDMVVWAVFGIVFLVAGIYFSFHAPPVH